MKQIIRILALAAFVPTIALSAERLTCKFVSVTGLVCFNFRELVAYDKAESKTDFLDNHQPVCEVSRPMLMCAGCDYVNNRRGVMNPVGRYKQMLEEKGYYAFTSLDEYSFVTHEGNVSCWD